MEENAKTEKYVKLLMKNGYNGSNENAIRVIEVLIVLAQIIHKHNSKD